MPNTKTQNFILHHGEFALQPRAGTGESVLTIDAIHTPIKCFSEAKGRVVAGLIDEFMDIVQAAAQDDEIRVFETPNCVVERLAERLDAATARRRANGKTGEYVALAADNQAAVAASGSAGAMAVEGNTAAAPKRKRGGLDPSVAFFIENCGDAEKRKKLLPGTNGQIRPPMKGEENCLLWASDLLLHYCGYRCYDGFGRERGIVYHDLDDVYHGVVWHSASTEKSPRVAKEKEFRIQYEREWTQSQAREWVEKEIAPVHRTVRFVDEGRVCQRSYEGERWTQATTANPAGAW